MAKALRTIPVILDIAREIQNLHSSFVVNFTIGWSGNGGPVPLCPIRFVGGCVCSDNHKMHILDDLVDLR
jgi:alpha-galactosidase/6-phospho-beta-glucosidase family protein